MIETEVSYSDTDAMGVVHHSNYLKYLETARIRWLREKGIDYRDWQEKKIHLPVVETHLRYKNPAFFGDVLEISIALRKEKLRFIFTYEIRNKKNKNLLALGRTEHVAVDATLKIVQPPAEFTKILEE